MEEEWHTQRKKNNKTQEEKTTKPTWKPVPAPNKPASEQFKELTQQTGIPNIFHHTSFTDFSM